MYLEKVLKYFCHKDFVSLRFYRYLVTILILNLQVGDADVRTIV